MNKTIEDRVRNKNKIHLERLSKLTTHFLKPTQSNRFDRINRSNLRTFVDQLYQERKKRSSITKKLTGKHKNPLPEKNAILSQDSQSNRILDMNKIQELGKGSSKTLPPLRKAFQDYLLGLGETQDMKSLLKKIARSKTYI